MESDDSANEDLASTARDLIIHNHLQLFGIVLLYYDQLLTTGDEVAYIWSRPRSISSIAFLLNRWLGFWGNIIVMIITTTKVSVKYYLARQLILLVNELTVGVLLMLRTYALYKSSRRILIFLACLTVVLLSVAGWSLTGQHSTPSPDIYSGCHIGITNASHRAAADVAISWEALFVFDTVIFVLTLLATHRAHHRRPISIFSPGRIPLTQLLLRDGAIMALANLTNIFTYYPLLKGMLSTFASNLAVALVSRLMLNLYKSDAAARIMSTADSSGPRTPMVLTSRIGWSQYEAELAQYSTEDAQAVELGHVPGETQAEIGSAPEPAAGGSSKAVHTES
ncbi:hypothetical protein PLICRDRAFT_40865 [Plicaturopsis crispa FD-325 SS-3]|nr:hypothetical protein PLICRDRAFT_40865 [Plicaturopsis crispa FD-325 SS-3]